MADDQFAGREARFNNTLPGIVGNFMKAVSAADGEARMESVKITQAILELPDVTLSQKIDILNSPDPLVYARTIPSVTYAEPRPFLAEKADLSMSMTVSASVSSESSIDSSSEASGSASVSFGFGLFKGTASASMKANVSTHSANKRSSDYSATTDMKLSMIRHPLPEGLAKTLDAMNAHAKAIDEINLALIQREIDRKVNVEGADLPETEGEKTNSTPRDA